MNLGVGPEWGVEEEVPDIGQSRHFRTRQTRPFLRCLNERWSQGTDLQQKWSEEHNGRLGYMRLTVEV